MTKFLERRNRLEKMSSLQNLALVNIQLKFPKVEEEGTTIKIKEHIEDKVMVEFKENGATSIEEIILEEATVTSEAIIKEEDKVNVEEKVKVEDKVKVEANISINLFVKYTTNLVIMLKIVKILLKKFQCFKNIWNSFLMINKMMAHNMYSLHFKLENQQHYRSPHILKLIMKILRY